MGEFNTVTNYENGISSYSQLAIQFMLYDGKLNIDRVEGFNPTITMQDTVLKNTLIKFKAHA